MSELAQQTDVAIDEHLQHELMAARQRASDVVAPFASLVDAAVAAHTERASLLHGSRRALDELVQELVQLSRPEEEPTD